MGRHLPRSRHVVRPAQLADADAIERVRVACWRQAYAHLLSARMLAGLDGSLGEGARRWRQAIRRRLEAGGAGLPSVAEIDDVVVGFAAAFDHARFPQVVDRHNDGGERPENLELRAIYLLAEHHGSGVGQDLLDAQIGDLPCFLWVAEGNPRAQAFYRRNGFRADGARNVVAEWENLVEIRMVRR